MAVDGAAFESAHTYPTNMCPTSARHMIAAVNLLNPDQALGTFLETLLQSQLVIEALLLYGVAYNSSFCASHPFVRFFLAGGAYRRKAGWTMKNLGNRGPTAAVNLVAVWSRTILEILWVVFDVGDKSRIQELRKLLRQKISLNRWDVDRDTALSLLTDATDWEHPCG